MLRLQMPRPWFETVTDLDAQQDVLRRRRYGVIEIVAGELQGIRLRPFPKLAWLGTVALHGARFHRQREGDFCLLYYNQPLGHSNFLSVTYVVSSSQATYATIRRASVVLDKVARIKGSDALLCDVANARISDRLLTRWGWEPHARQRWHRNFIKRFYGTYPA